MGLAPALAAMQISISVFQEGSMHTSRYTIYVDLPGNDRERSCSSMAIPGLKGEQ
jgi:hypothetical protein